MIFFPEFMNFRCLLQPFKYLLATRLVDCGRSHIALQYLESITLDLMKDVGEYELDFMEHVAELAERIKYSDSKPLVNDSTDKQWLTDLKRVVNEVIMCLNSVRKGIKRLIGCGCVRAHSHWFQREMCTSCCEY